MANVELFTLREIFTKEDYRLFTEIEKEFSTLRKDYKINKKEYVLIRRKHYRGLGMFIPSQSWTYTDSNGCWLDKAINLDKESGLEVQQPKVSSLTLIQRTVASKESARAWHVFYSLCKGKKYREIEQKSALKPTEVLSSILTLLSHLCCPPTTSSPRVLNPSVFTMKNYMIWTDFLQKEVCDE
jgi:hypothetical protein